MGEDKQMCTDEKVKYDIRQIQSLLLILNDESVWNLLKDLLHAILENISTYIY